MNKVLSLLGLCRRAGRLVYGLDTVLATTCVLILVAEDAGAALRRKLKNQAHRVLPCTKAALGHGIGVETCAVVGLTDQGFCNKIIGLLDANGVSDNNFTMDNTKLSVQ